MFGNAISDGTLQISSTVGYIRAYDLNANLIYKLTSLVISSPGQPVGQNVFIVSSVTSKEQLWSYVGSSSAPTLAFYQEGSIVYVFFLESVIAQANNGTDSIAFFFKRYDIPWSDAGSKLDIPTETRGLLLCHIRRLSELESQGGRTEFATEQSLIRERQNLGFTV